MPGKNIPPIFPTNPAQHHSHSTSMATTGEHEPDLVTCYVKEAFNQSDALYSKQISRPHWINQRLRASLMMATSQ